MSTLASRQEAATEVAALLHCACVSLSVWLSRDRPKGYHTIRGNGEATNAHWMRCWYPRPPRYILCIFCVRHCLFLVLYCPGVHSTIGIIASPPLGVYMRA